jgi:hypothetical protein
MRRLPGAGDIGWGSYRPRTVEETVAGPTCCARRLCHTFSGIRRAVPAGSRFRPVIMPRMVRTTPGTHPGSAQIAGRVRQPACTTPCGRRRPCLRWWIGRPDRAAARTRRESGGRLPGYPEPGSCWAHSFGGSGGPRASFGRRRNSFAGPMPVKGRDRKFQWVRRQPCLVLADTNAWIWEVPRYYVAAAQLPTNGHDTGPPAGPVRVQGAGGRGPRWPCPIGRCLAGRFSSRCVALPIRQRSLLPISPARLSRRGWMACRADPGGLTGWPGLMTLRCACRVPWAGAGRGGRDGRGRWAGGWR